MKIYRIKLIIFYASIVVALLLFTGLNNAQDTTGIDVSLQINSGLADPNWMITDISEIDQIKEFIEGLPTAQPVEPPISGAFLLLNKGIPDFPEYVYVFDGVIELKKADGTIQLFQDTKGLDPFLVNKARENSIVLSGFSSGDQDDDGVPDTQDACLNSDVKSPTIFVYTCNVGVPNQLLSGGCTITDKIIVCGTDARNHGQFVICVTQLTDNLRNSGMISDNDKDKIQSCAAQANIPPTLPGDLDHDGDADNDDLNILLADRNKPVSQSACGIACDLDGDGKITALDARKLTLLCTRPRCATQ